MTNWSELYPQDTQPTPEQITQFIDSPLWGAFCKYIEDAYGVSPDYAYSKCSGQMGWNVKYKKGRRALCTLYPMDGYFIALVVVGNREQANAGLHLPSLSVYTQALYNRTPFTAGGRWLMMEVRTSAVLEDVKMLIGVRAVKRTANSIITIEFIF